MDVEVDAEDEDDVVLTFYWDLPLAPEGVAGVRKGGLRVSSISSSPSNDPESESEFAITSRLRLRSHNDNDTAAASSSSSSSTESASSSSSYLPLPRQFVFKKRKWKKLTHHRTHPMHSFHRDISPGGDVQTHPRPPHRHHPGPRRRRHHPHTAPLASRWQYTARRTC